MRLDKYLSGKALDTYKQKREKWILSAIVTTFFPFIVALMLELIYGTFDIFEVFKNGDILILFYSLTIAILFDLWNVKRNNPQKDMMLQRSFCLLLLVLFSQMCLYGALKTNSMDSVVLIIFTNLVIIGASYFACNFVLLHIFLYTMTKEDE